MPPTDFVGENLSWSVAGAGATIDAEGLVSIPTDTPLAELVTVTATNSGGAAASAFMVTVEATDAPEIPLTPTAADWALEAVSLAAGTHTGVFALSPALGAVEVQWLGVDVAELRDRGRARAALQPDRRARRQPLAARQPGGQERAPAGERHQPAPYPDALPDRGRRGLVVPFREPAHARRVAAAGRAAGRGVERHAVPDRRRGGRSASRAATRGRCGTG